MNYDEFEWIKIKAEYALIIAQREYEFLEDLDDIYHRVDGFEPSPKQIEVLERIRKKQ